MKWLTFAYNGQMHIGLWHSSEETILSMTDSLQAKGIVMDNMIDLINAPIDVQQIVQELADDWEASGAEGHTGERRTYKRDDVEWLAPIPVPRKNIFCIGRNYADHVKERQAEMPEQLVVFTKPPTSVIGDGKKIHRYRNLTNQLDYEGELAVVIGRGGRGIRKEDALSHVFGYTIVNDVTARDVQKKHIQFFLGKSFDTFCPMGPWIVTASEIPNPGVLRIQTRVDDHTRQSASTEQLLFDIPTIIATISAGITLEPGDIIATGTPAGVGAGFSPPRFLDTGCHIEIEIERIGILRNIVTE